MATGRFLHGTAGWSYTDWVGPFYEEGTAQGDFVETYARHFPAVEVDSTYYRIPSAKMTARWANVTPDGFLFSPKMVGEVTHKKFLEDCGDLVRRYLNALSPLGEKLGPIILQFPYFKKAQGITLDVFLGRLLPFLDELPKGPCFAVEVRNKPFLKPKLFDSLRDRRVPLVLIDHAWMPPPKELAKIDTLFTGDRVPIRLLGDRYGIEKITRTWEKTVVDREERLQDWAGLIREALKSGRDVNAFANNHYAGHAPSTARRLAELVG
jgi:uncharacterized protein YecE (DUF72 family)